MPLTDTALAKLGLVQVSLRCFVLFLWLAVTLLYLPFLSIAVHMYISPPLCLLLPALGGVLYLRYGRPKNPKPLCLFLALLGIATLTSLIPGLSAIPALFLLGTLSPAII